MVRTKSALGVTRAVATASVTTPLALTEPPLAWKVVSTETASAKERLPPTIE